MGARDEDGAGLPPYGLERGVGGAVAPARALAKTAATPDHLSWFSAWTIAMERRLSYIFDVDEHHCGKKVIAASKPRPVLVDFWAEWCAPCRALTPVPERLAHACQGEWLLAKVDENMRLAGHYRLHGFPPVLQFHDGHETGRFSGFKAQHCIRELLHERLAHG